MFNTSNHSSERSRREANHSQRVPSTQRCRSARSASSSQHSESKATWKIPVWVHCEQCYNNHAMNPKMSLLSCGHIFCRTCLRVDNSLPHEPISCLRCKTVVTHIPLDAPLDEKLHGMFQQSWMDPVLQIDLKNMQFMMTKSQNYSKYLAKSIKQNANVPPKWMQRYNEAKKTIEHIQQLQKLQNELAIKTESIKSACSKKYKNIQMLRSYYQRKKTNSQLPEHQHHKGQSHHPQKDMRFVSSGRNEQSNQYIGQLKSHLPTNRSDGNIRNSSQRISPAAQRQNIRVNEYREDTSKHSSDSVSRRPPMQSATFRPQTKVFKVDSQRFEPQGHAQKRLVPSYGYDEYTNPPKRAAAQYPVRREIILDTSISSVGSSQVPNYNPMTKYNNRPNNTLQISSYK